MLDDIKEGTRDTSEEQLEVDGSSPALDQQIILNGAFRPTVPLNTLTLSVLGFHYILKSVDLSHVGSQKTQR